MLFEKLLVGSTSSGPTPPSGNLYGAGGNLAGQQGRGTNTEFASPFTLVGSSTLWSKMYCSIGGVSANSRANTSFALGIQSNGSLWGTGKNFQGCLGLGNTTAVNTWTQIGPVCSGSYLYKDVRGCGGSVA